MLFFIAIYNYLNMNKATAGDEKQIVIISEISVLKTRRPTAWAAGRLSVLRNARIAH